SGIEPDGARAVFANCHEFFGRFAAAKITDRGDSAFGIDEEDAIGFRADPKVATAILEQLDDGAGVQAIAFTKYSKFDPSTGAGVTNAVEANKAELSAEPKITIAGLSQGDDSVAWQPVFSHPKPVDGV